MVDEGPLPQRGTRSTGAPKSGVVDEALVAAAGRGGPAEVWINPPKPRALEEVALTH
jgi:hypothetical protein